MYKVLAEFKIGETVRKVGETIPTSEIKDNVFLTFYLSNGSLEEIKSQKSETVEPKTNHKKK